MRSRPEDIYRDISSPVMDPRLDPEAEHRSFLSTLAIIVSSIVAIKAGSYALRKAGMSALSQAASKLPPIRESAIKEGARTLADDFAKFATKIESDIDRLGKSIPEGDTLGRFKANVAEKAWKYAKNAPFELPVVYGVNEVLYDRKKEDKEVPTVQKFGELLLYDAIGSIVAPAALKPAWTAFSRTPAAAMMRENLARYGEAAFVQLHKYSMQGAKYGTMLSSAINSVFREGLSKEEANIRNASSTFYQRFMQGWEKGRVKWQSRIDNLTDVRIIQRIRSADTQSRKAFQNYLYGKYQKIYTQSIQDEAASQGISLTPDEADDLYEAIIRGESPHKHMPKNLFGWLVDDTPLEDRLHTGGSNWFRDRFYHNQASIETVEKILTKKNHKIAGVTGGLENFLNRVTEKANRKFYIDIGTYGDDLKNIRISFNKTSSEFMYSRLAEESPIVGKFNAFGVRKASIKEYNEYVMSSQHMTPRARAKMTKFMEKILPEEGERFFTGEEIADPFILRTRSGKILDFSFLPSIGRKIMTGFEANIKIPILGFNPLQLFQVNARMRSRTAGYINWITPGERHPFISETILSRPYLKIGKNIYRTSMDEFERGFSFSKIPGEWNSFVTDSTSVLGRTVQAITGMYDYIQEDTPQGAIKKKFPWLVKLLAIDPQSSGSIPNILKRWFVGQPAYALSQWAKKKGYGRLANWLEGLIPEDYIPLSINRLLSGGISNLSKEEVRAVDENLRKIMAMFHPSVPTEVVDDIVSGKIKTGMIFREGNEQIRKFLARDVEGNLIETDIEDILKLISTGNKDDLQEALRIINADAKFRASKVGGSLGRAFDQNLRTHYESIGKAGEEYLDTKMPSSAFSEGERYQYQRVEKDIINYIMARPAIILSKANHIEALNAFKELDVFVDTLEESGRYSRRTISKMRSAIASAKLITINAVFRNAETRLSILNMDRNLGKEIRGMVEEWQRLPFGKAWRSLTKDQVFEKTPINKFGSNYTYIPTFQSAMESDAYGAMKGVFMNGGIKTDASIWAYHMVNRLTPIFEMVGLGFEPGRFKSATDLLVGGIILRRFLPAMAAVEAYRYLDWKAEEATDQSISEELIKYGVVYPSIGAAKVGRLFGVQEAAKWFGKVTGEEDRMSFLKYAQMKGDELREFWEEGDVPIRKGRWWLLNSQPFKGGRTLYYAPNIYRRIESRYRYTWQGGAGPEEMYFSHSWLPTPEYPLAPLQRILDPYWFERETFHMRPYMKTGDFFTGPYGPINPILNATIGQIIKPTRKMHSDAWAELESGVYADSGQPIKGLSVGVQLAQAQIAQSNQEAINSGKAIAAVQNATPIQPYGVGAQNAILLYQQFGIPVQGLIASTPESTIQRYPTEFASYNQVISKPISQFTTIGETLYRSQEMLGIYGFSMQSLREKLGLPGEWQPQARIEEASTAYGFGGRFWGANLGGMGDIVIPGLGGLSNVAFSEIFRRFVPKEFGGERINIARNDVWQQYPWLPGPYSDYMRDFSRGDPYALPGGNMLLPGEAYERLYGNIIGEPGVYDWQDQLKILSSMAPWSPEFHSVMRGASRRIKTPEQEEFYEEIKRQVSDINQKYRFAEYRFLEEPELKTNRFTIESISPEGLINVKEIPEPISIAGLKTGELLSSFLQKRYSPGDVIDVTTDLGRPRYTMTQQERVIEGMVDGLTKEAVKAGVPEKTGGELLDYYARTNEFERSIGRTWEKFSHAWNPLTTKFLNRRSALETYERTQVYGKEFAPWSTPWESFIEPQFTSLETKSLFGSILGGTILGAAFGRTLKAKAILGILGGIGAALGKGYISANEALTGHRWVPGDVRKEWEAEEYTDILTYVHRARVYNALRKRALESGETDPETFWARYVSAKREYRKRNTEGTISQLTGYITPSLEEFAQENPLAAEAIAWRQKMGETLYGADLNGALSTIYRAFPKSRRPFLESFLNARTKDREKILDVLPLLERRVLEAHWGLPVEELPSLDRYFENHHLPHPASMFWNPNLDIEKMKIKILDKTDIPMSEFGYYPQEVAEANLYPIPAPDMEAPNNQFKIQQQLHEILSNMGMYGISMSISPSPEPGTRVNFNVKLDISDRIKEYLQNM